MRLFIDECLSPVLARRLNAAGIHEAVHPLDLGRCGEPDHKVLERCLAEDWTIVTENARDFLRLLGKIDLHPGLILLPTGNRDRAWESLSRIIEYLNESGDPARLMVNHVVEMDRSGAVMMSVLAATQE